MSGCFGLLTFLHSFASYDGLMIRLNISCCLHPFSQPINEINSGRKQQPCHPRMEGAKSTSILVDLVLPVLLRPSTKRNKKHQCTLVAHG